jgi:hypothetical protein
LAKELGQNQNFGSTTQWGGATHVKNFSGNDPSRKKTGMPSPLIVQKSADFEVSNAGKMLIVSVSNLIVEMRNFVKFIRNIMEN